MVWLLISTISLSKAIQTITKNKRKNFFRIILRFSSEIFSSLMYSIVSNLTIPESSVKCFKINVTYILYPHEQSTQYYNTCCMGWKRKATLLYKVFGPPHENSNKLVCAISKGSDHPSEEYQHSLIRTFGVQLLKVYEDNSCFSHFY